MFADFFFFKLHVSNDYGTVQASVSKALTHSSAGQQERSHTERTSLLKVRLSLCGSHSNLA